MNTKRFASAHLGALLLLSVQSSLAVAITCTATADLRPFGTGASADTIRVTHQETIGGTVPAEYNLTFRVVNPDGEILGDFSETLWDNHSVTYKIGEIYGKAHVSLPWVYAPNVVQVVEIGNPPHDMQAVYKDNGTGQLIPLTFTCDYGQLPL